MKNKGLIIFGIIICSIVVILLTAFLIFGINNKFKFKFNSSESNNLVINQEYDNIYDKINIYGESANIKIFNSDSSKIKVVVYGKEDKNQVIVEDNTLKIESKDNNNCKFFCLNLKIARIEVYLPSDYDKEIDINSKYGDINIDKFNNISLNLKLNYGDVTIDSCKDVVIECNYGDIKINNIYNYLDINSNYGDIEIDNLNINKDSNIKADFGDIKINGTNQIYIDAKTSLGDTKINNNYNKSDITLKIKNDFGDIKVNN